LNAKVVRLGFESFVKYIIPEYFIFELQMI